MLLHSRSRCAKLVLTGFYSPKISITRDAESIGKRRKPGILWFNLISNGWKILNLANILQYCDDEASFMNALMWTFWDIHVCDHLLSRYIFTWVLYSSSANGSEEPSVSRRHSHWSSQASSARYEHYRLSEHKNAGSASCCAGLVCLAGLLPWSWSERGARI